MVAARCARRALAVAVLALACSGCDSGDRPAQQSASQQAAAAPPQAAVASPVTHDALPRSVAGITLGMTRAAAEGKVGHLTCHAGKAGCEVCDPETEQGGDIHHLQLYLHHDTVISVSYEGPAPANVWDVLNQLMDRYGNPALSGVRERDQTGRLHEIYGWKDDQSFYSVRFVWKDAPAEGRELLGTATALWDRKGYLLWESETQPPGAPPAEPGGAREPV
jgi:hypothetical protein